MAETVPLLFTPDINALRNFYLKLGFVQTGAWIPDTELKWCEVVFDEAKLMLQASDSKINRHGQQDIEIFIICDDVVPIQTAWKNSGIAVSDVQEAFYGMRQVFVRDTDDRLICFESKATNSFK